MTRNPLRLLVQWPRFGPYHLARLRTLNEACDRSGWTLTALETASTDDLYAWREETGPTAFPREVLFPGRSFHDLSPKAMHRAMTEALDRLQPDAVAIHSYAFPDARAALLWCRKNRRAAVLMLDSRADDARRRGWREAFKRRIVAQYDAALTAGAPQRRYLEALGVPPEVIFEGYDVVDNAAFAQAARQSLGGNAEVLRLPGLADASPFFLASNRFIPRKNLPLLLRAFARYRARAGNQAWRLVMLGDGEQRGELEALAETLGIGAAVAWAGFRQIDEIPAYYARAGAFVHPSSADQWALVVNEAMACGLPVVVSTGAGCVEDLVDEGRNGFSFSPGDADALANHLFALAHGDLDLGAMGQRSREIVADWSLQRFATSMLAGAEAGRTRAGHGLDPLVVLGFWALRRLARGPEAFHTVQS